MKVFIVFYFNHCSGCPGREASIYMQHGSESRSAGSLPQQGSPWYTGLWNQIWVTMATMGASRKFSKWNIYSGHQLKWLRESEERDKHVLSLTPPSSWVCGEKECKKKSLPYFPQFNFFLNVLKLLLSDASMSEFI